MVYSMTGYGSAAFDFDQLKVSVEIKSLNNKFLDLNIKVPSRLIKWELEIRKIISANLKRGKISVSIQAELPKNLLKPPAINKDLLKKYHDQFTDVCSGLDLEVPGLSYFLTLPEVLEEAGNEPGEDEWSQVEKILLEAIQSINSSRVEEGGALKEDILNRTQTIQENLEKCQEVEGDRLDHIRKKVLQNLQELKGKIDYDSNRFEQELLYYSEKLDINEEFVRLSKHLEYLRSTLAEDSYELGKKLGFISQEMGREINTIGSKANYAPLQVYVIKMKEELEKIKEQVFNVV